MGLTRLAYGFPTSFRREETFCGKTEGVPLSFKPKPNIFEIL
jgi:hypothetical protein